MNDIVFYNLIYFLASFFLVYPPTEVQLIGFSIPTLFSSVLGSEQLCFIHYQITRICVTVLVHSAIPLGYYLFIGLAVPELDLFSIQEVSIYWQCYLLFSISFTIGLCTLVYYWSMNDFVNHPVSVKLKAMSNAANWNQVANEINIEFRRVDKFSTGTSFYNRLYLTDNWLIKVNLYSLNLCKQADADLTLTHSNELNLTTDGSPSMQLLSILVKPVASTGQKPFYLKLNSLEYKDFNDKLTRPVQAACDIVIKQSLPDQFLDSFRNQVELNGVFQFKRSEVEACIGCMRKPSDVKLVKRCEALESGECRNCLCRPMWCLECMGKWFAYRQDQSQPNTWLAGKASCATCRATFCMLDIAKLELVD